MLRTSIAGCCLALLAACTTTLPSRAPPATIPPAALAGTGAATVTIQGIVVPDADGSVTKLLADYARLPGHKAVAIALTAQGEYAAGVSSSGSGLAPAATFALQDCAANRAARALVAACELLRIDDRELELGSAFRRRLRLHDSTAPTLLWRLRSADATVYVGGSLHVLRPTMLPLPAAFDRAYAASEDLTVEVDVTGVSQTQLVALTHRYGALPDGQTLAQLLPADAIGKLQRRGEQLGAPWSELERLCPGQITLTLTTLALIGNGFDPGAGVDVMYLERAHADGKPVAGIETIESQLALLQAAPLATLTQYIDEQSDDRAVQATLSSVMAAWFQADQRALLDMFDSPGMAPETLAWNARMIAARNIGMAAKVVALLRTGKGTHFVLVGAGHLPGPSGVIALLRDAGFDAVQLDRAGEPLPAARSAAPASAAHTPT